MHKGEIIAKVSKKAGCSKKEVGEIVDAVLDEISKVLKIGKEVVFTGFGTFRVKKRAARIGRNPQTGRKIKIRAKRVPVFKPGKGLRKVVK